MGLARRMTPAATQETGAPMAIDQMLTDMMTTAVEGGIGYWSAASSYRWDCPPAERHVTLHPNQESGGDFAVTRVDLAAIKRAMNKVAYGNFSDVPECERPNQEARRVCGALLRNPDADVDYDSTVADQVAQVAVLGKVVFG